MDLYYKDFDLSHFTYGLNVSDIHLKKHKTFLTMLLTQGDNKGYFSKQKMTDIFGIDYYNDLGKNTVQGAKYEFSDKDNIWNFEKHNPIIETLETVQDRTKQKKQLKIKRRDDNILFNRLFKIISIGDNKRKKYSLYTLNLTHEELQDLKKQYKIKKATKLQSKIKDNTNISKNKIKIDSTKITHLIEPYKKIYFSDTVYEDIQQSKDSINNRITAINKIDMILDSIKNDVFEVLSEKKLSGRMYNELQGLPRELRKVLFSEYIENDMNAAAPTFFAQVFKQIIEKDQKVYLDDFIKKYTGNKQFNKVAILENIKNGKATILDKYTTTEKDTIREQIAEVIKGEEIRLPQDKQFIDLAKEVLTMIFFGAVTTNRRYIKKYKYIDTDNLTVQDEDIEIKKGTAIQEALKKAVYVDRFFNSELVQEMLNTVDITMSVIYKYLKNENMNKDFTVLRCNGTKLTLDYINRDASNEEEKAKIISKAKALAHFYQSWESKALVAMQKAYTKEVGYKNNYYLLIHDGIYTYKNIDKRILEESTKNLKGVDFNIRIKIEQNS